MHTLQRTRTGTRPGPSPRRWSRKFGQTKFVFRELVLASYRPGFGFTVLDVRIVAAAGRFLFGTTGHFLVDGIKVVLVLGRPDVMVVTLMMVAGLFVIGRKRKVGVTQWGQLTRTVAAVFNIE